MTQVTAQQKGRTLDGDPSLRNWWDWVWKNCLWKTTHRLSSQNTPGLEHYTGGGVGIRPLVPYDFSNTFPLFHYCLDSNLARLFYCKEKTDKLQSPPKTFRQNWEWIVYLKSTFANSVTEPHWQREKNELAYWTVHLTNLALAIWLNGWFIRSAVSTSSSLQAPENIVLLDFIQPYKEKTKQ